MGAIFLSEDKGHVGIKWAPFSWLRTKITWGMGAIFLTGDKDYVGVKMGTIFLTEDKGNVKI